MPLGLCSRLPGGGTAVAGGGPTLQHERGSGVWAPSTRRVAIVLGALLAWSGLVPGAAAHLLAPSLLELREKDSGRVEVIWTTPRLRSAGVDLRPELPPHCAQQGEPSVGGDATRVTLRWRVDCGERGLVGQVLRVHGLERSRTEALLRIEFADGRLVRALLRGGDPGFAVPARARPWAVTADYLTLGFRHILEGLDHLLFILGLMLLVHGVRMLVWTVTSFTIGHSVTLSLAALGFVSFPSRIVELVIAASILVLAVELARGPSAAGSRLRRRPWAVALLFGLLHGFGFAGALAEVGLPAEEIPLALLSFNIGIELGQLVFVAAVMFARLALQPLASRGPGWLTQLPAYAIGSLAAYWCMERAAALF